MPSLFPEINLPTIAIPQSSQTTKKFLRAPKFDVLTGDFLLDESGRMLFDDEQAAFENWCLKVCQTERNSRLAYSDKIGTEFEAAMKLPSPEAAKSAIVRTLTEAILVHPKAEAVKNFSFSGDGDNLSVTFVIQSRDGDFTATVTV